MKHVHRRIVLPVACLAAMLLSGCATMFHRGNGLRVTQEEGGRKVGKLAMNLDHLTRDVRIYEGEQELQISFVRDHIVSTAIDNSLNQTLASGSCQAPCTYTWTETRRWGPGVFLDPRRAHTLRLVRGDQEATVTVKTSFRVKWYFANMLLFVAGPIGWIVDGVTGSWNEFSRLDVDKVFRHEASVASRQGSLR